MTSSFAELKLARSKRQSVPGAATGGGGEAVAVEEGKVDIHTVVSLQPPPIQSTTTDEEPATITASVPTVSYPDFPLNISIQHTPSSGRSLFTTSAIPKATRIISTNPHAFALSTPCLPTYCSNCWLSPYELAVKRGDLGPTASSSSSSSVLSKGLNRCSGCEITRYCSKECQAAAWTSHATECRALRTARTIAREKSNWAREMGKPAGGPEDKEDGWIPPESVRALGKICWARRKDLLSRGKSAPSTIVPDSTDSYAPIRSLQSHRPTLTASERETFAKLAIELARYLSCGEPGAWGAVIAKDDEGNAGTQTIGSEEKQLRLVDMRSFGFDGSGEVMDLCCAFASNSFTLSSTTLTPIGVAISPLVALINHSCEPNAVVVFPGGGRPGEKGMQVVALRDLDAGEEILTSYIDVAVPYHIRQRLLKETYHFDCACTLCRRSGPKRKPGKGIWVDPRWAVRHPDCPAGNGMAAMPDLALGLADCTCNACGREFEVVVGRIRNLNTLAEKYLNASGKNVEVDLADLTSTVEALKEVLPISSHPLLPLLRIQSLLYSETIYAAEQTTSDLFNAIQALAMHWKGSQAVYVPNQPTLGIMLAELGKLLNAEAGNEGESGRSTADEANLAIKLPTDVSGRMGLARETMMNALKVLRVGFGRGGGLVGKELEMLVEGITREMSISRRR